MSRLPVVTGVSPKEGPPGTRVTIRGENLGNSPDDIIGLIICNSDCLLSAEWVSRNKIIARSGPGKGKGDIIIITKSGGKGTCTVQFRGYHETIGPLKESAVWVDESHLSGTGRHRALVPSSYQQEDPLGLSVENTVKKYPEEELQDLFPDSNGEFGSENFSPSWFLLQNHHGTSFDDLKAGLSFLKRRVEAQKEGQISFLKAHAGSVVEQLDTLTILKQAVEKNKVKLGNDMTASLEKSIHMAKAEADRLFDDVLRRKDEADGTRNALAVLHRFRFLFNLPAVIDRNIQKGEYDLVINDYARANNLYRNSEVQIFKRVLQEAERKILNLREILTEKLQRYPSSLDEQKKIIRNLVNLESPNDPAWLCITGQYKYCSRVLFESKDKFLNEDQEEAVRNALAGKSKKTNNASAGTFETQPATVPARVSFLEELSDIFTSVFPELWKLGQAYFNKELYVRVEPSKQEEFKTMILDIATIFSQLIRAALLPHTLDRHSPHRAQFGLWSNFSTNPEQESVGSWLVHCLRCVRACYVELLVLDLPSAPLDAIRDLLHDLRVHCMRTLLMHAAESVSQLTGKENWNTEFIESHGCITQLPHLFESQVVECLQLVKETVFQSEQRETNLMDNQSVLNDLNLLVQKLLFSFAKNIERTILSDQQDQSEEPTRESKLLLGLSNCQYTLLNILPRFHDHWQKLGYPDLSGAIQSAKELLVKTEERLMEAYLEEKVEPLIGIVEPSMYAGRFDWNKNLANDDVRPYCKEIIMNMIAVHSEVAQICPSLVSRILERVVREVAAELARLFSCVKQFSHSGALQAKADIAALSRACLYIKPSEKSARSSIKDSFAEAADLIPSLANQAEQERLKKILTSFEERMKFQLLCLQLN